MATITTTDISLLRLMQLSSSTLPVGGYSFSQGLETAVEQGWVSNREQTADWLRLVMAESLAKVDLPLLQRLFITAQENNEQNFRYWNATVLACRETEELLLTETAMGEALRRLLSNLDVEIPNIEGQKISFIAGFAVAAYHWQVDEQAVLVGYLWSWLENQIAAATKLVPLGQTAAQQLLVELGEHLSEIVEASQNVKDENIGSSLPGMAMASSWHETQYSRLFRS